MTGRTTRSNHPLLRHGPLLLASIAMAAGLAATAQGFGTVRGMGQDAEHGRITRLALTCTARRAADACFEAETLASLAGAPGEFGAVGAPDRGRGMLASDAHCSGGDVLDVPGYPRTAAEAQASLSECRSYMLDNLDHAVADAAALLDDSGRIRPGELPGIVGCVYAGMEHGRAKCNILAHLGRILHAAQDFYSHSNWVGVPDPARPVGVENPPGLGNAGRAPWLDLRAADPAFPPGLISGCFDNGSFLDEASGCQYGDGGAHRVRHLDLNKDTGQMEPAIGAGSTARGAVGDNFRRAVEAAVEDSIDKWATFRERLAAAYGAERAALMICALTRDDPVDACAALPGVPGGE